MPGLSGPVYGLHHPGGCRGEVAGQSPAVPDAYCPQWKTGDRRLLPRCLGDMGVTGLLCEMGVVEDVVLAVAVVSGALGAVAEL